MKNDFEHYEREFDDQVYEDEFYEENYTEEELSDEDDLEDNKRTNKDMFDDDSDDNYLSDDDDLGEKRIHVSYACDDCDYRWEEVIIKTDEFDDEEPEILCPMCGSLHVEQI